MNDRQDPRHSAAVHLLTDGHVVRFSIKTTSAGVLLPWHLRNHPQATLRISSADFPPDGDLKITTLGVSCTLNFHGSPHWCRFPWASVVGMRNQDDSGIEWIPGRHPSHRAPVRSRGKRCVKAHGLRLIRGGGGESRCH